MSRFRSFCRGFLRGLCVANDFDVQDKTPVFLTKTKLRGFELRGFVEVSVFILFEVFQDTTQNIAYNQPESKTKTQKHKTN